MTSLSDNITSILGKVRNQTLLDTDDYNTLVEIKAHLKKEHDYIRNLERFAFEQKQKLTGEA